VTVAYRETEVLFGRADAIYWRIMMKFRAVGILSLLVLTLGCSNTTLNPAKSQAARSYSGTASVGDFLSITLDPTAQTLSYTNKSNGDTGSNIPYILNSDGTYAVNDPQGNLVAAYEVPGFGLLVEAEKAGPNHNALALVTAVTTGSNISTTTWANQSFNYMDFRTAAGGVEIGSVVMDAQGNVSNDGYWPYGAVTGQQTFNTGSMPASAFTVDPSGAFMTAPAPGDSGAFITVFGTPNGEFFIDTPSGAIIGLQKATSKDFDPTTAGTYKAIYYQKTGANTGPGNVETGTPSLGNATIVVTANAQITVTDSTGTVIMQATLAPVADTAYLYGTAGELNDPCFGLFTFQLTTGSSQQDVFVAFINQALLFSSFTAALPVGQSSTYNYLYGVGLQ
jgi:hypothetical protein